MKLVGAFWIPLALLLGSGARVAPPIACALEPAAVSPVGEIHHRHSPVQVDVNRPRTPFDCDLPIGKDWYGSRDRCLAYLCEGRNVYNEYIFDAHNRRRRNPCYGQSPTDFPDE